MRAPSSNERTPSLERPVAPSLDELSLLLARARNRVEWRVVRVGAHRSTFDALTELASDLGVVLPKRCPVPSNMAEARDAVSQVLSYIERVQLSPETRARIGVHLIPLRCFAHGQSVGASPIEREATSC
jgi:hypothetical protein